MLDAEQSRRLDELVGEAAVALHETMTALARDIAAVEMASRFTKVWDIAERHAAEARVFAQAEAEVARELSERLTARLINPHASA